MSKDMNDFTSDTLVDQSSTAALLPTELWLQIFIRLTRRDLLAAALVSRHLRRPAYSLLFLSCVLSLGRPRRLREMLALYTSPDIAPCVQECTVLGYRHNSPTDVTRIWAAIPHFTNVRYLVIQYVRMTPMAVAAIASNARLISCSLVCCMTDFPRPSASEAAAISLRTFLLHNERIPAFPCDGHWLRLLNLHVLQVLDLAQPYSTEFFIEYLVHEPEIRFPVLKTLRLHLGGAEGLHRLIFRALPALRTLNVDTFHTRVDYPAKHTRLTLPSDAVPLLSSFHGPIIHATQFCTGRPLMRHLKLYGDNNFTRACTAQQLLPVLPTIASSAPSLTSLEIRVAFPLEELIPALFNGAFPALRSLRLFVPGYPPERFNSIPTFPKLNDVLGTLAMLALTLQLEVLYLAYHRAKPAWWRDDPTYSAQMTAAIRDLGQRSPRLRCICLCLDVIQGDWGTIQVKQPDRTTIWRWIRGYDSDGRETETLTESRVDGAECIDGRKPNMGVRDDDYEENNVADELDEEWLAVTAAHREE